MGAKRHRNLAALQAGALAITIMSPAPAGVAPVWIGYIGLLVGAASAALLVMNLCLWYEALGQQSRQAAPQPGGDEVSGAVSAGHHVGYASNREAGRGG